MSNSNGTLRSRHAALTRSLILDAAIALLTEEDAAELSVRSAHVATMGPQAVDVFYVVEPGAAALTDERAAVAVHAVRKALAPTVTLDV